MNYQNNPKGRQNFILDWLKEDPTLSYSVIFAKYSVVFAKSSKTFDKDWISSNNELKSYQETINSERLKESIKLEKQAVRKAILQKHEALEILTEIAKGTPKKVEGQIIMPTANERRGAIETMAKLEGWESPKKTENININIDKTPIFNDISLDE